MICPVCGTLNEDHVPFCGGCGGRLVPLQPVNPQPAYQQPVYQQPVYQAPNPPVYPYWQPNHPAMKAPVPGKGFGVAGMILGIASLLLFSLWIVAGICAVLAIIFSAVALSKAKQAGRNNGMALAGLICGAVGLAIAVLFGVTVMDIMSTYGMDLTEIGMDYTKAM